MLHHKLELGPHRKIVVAIIAIDEPMLFCKYEQGRIWWTKDPGEAGGWTSVERAKSYAKKLTDGEYDGRLEKWVIGNEFRAVKVSSIRSYDLEVV